LASVAVTTTAHAQAQKADKAARHEEVRQKRLREEAAQAVELAAEATRSAAAKAIAEACEQEHTVAVQSALSLKAEHDRAQGRLDAAKAVNAAIKHRDEVLAATREANK